MLSPKSVVKHRKNNKCARDKKKLNQRVSEYGCKTETRKNTVINSATYKI